MAILPQLLRAIRRWVEPPPEVYEDEEYRLAYQHLLKFEPKPEVDYGWAIDYAERHFERLWSVHEALEEKAEAVIKIFASGGALLALGAIAGIEKFSLVSGLFWSLGLLLALFAVLSAGKVRYPKTTFMPPSAAWTASIAEERGKQARAAFIAQWHLASEGLRLGSARKAAALKRAMLFGFAALVCLSIAFPAGLIVSRM